MFEYQAHEHIQHFIKEALHEDLGDGDHTSLATVPASATGSASLLVKDTGVLAGVELAKAIFHYVDPKSKLTFFKQDGDWIEPGMIVLEVGGLSQSILKAERLVLNCMQRMSGIATYTRSLVQIIQGSKAKLLDTRKTTPNFRLAEKWACKIGGAENHRYALFDMILIKDNHIKAAGGIQAALDNCLSYCNQQNIQIPVIVEVKDEVEFLIALKHPIVNRILIDNHIPAVIENYIHYRNTIAPDKKLEISGGITLDTITPYLIQGIHCISVGALTHHATSVDISLKIV